MANYLLNEELRRLVVQVCNQHMSSFQPRPKRGRRVRNSGGAEAAPSDDTLRWAKVVEPADGGNTVTEDSIGKCYVVFPKYQITATLPPSGWTSQEAYVEFRSLHDTPCPVGSLIRLYCEKPFWFGSVWPRTEEEYNADITQPLRFSKETPSKRPVWGEMVMATEELYALDGHGPKTILWLPDTASEAKHMRWDSEECPA